MTDDLALPFSAPAGPALQWKFGDLTYAHPHHVEGKSLMRVRDGSLCLIASPQVDPLVRMLGAVSGVSTITNHPVSENPARLSPSEAALRLMALRKPDMVVLDIHGAQDDAPYDIALATGTGAMTAGQERLCGLFAEISHQHGLRCVFKTENNQPGALTSRARQMLGIENVLQIEVARSLRQPQGRNGASLLGVMGEVIQRIRLS